MTVICNYCGEKAKFVTGRFIYPTRPDLFSRNFYVCENGHERAYVGCHDGTSEAFGILADSALRRRKSAAHRAFDPLWRSKRMSRKAAYAWLASHMGLSAKECHIGLFDLDMCNESIRICNEFKSEAI